MRVVATQRQKMPFSPSIPATLLPGHLGHPDPLRERLGQTSGGSAYTCASLPRLAARTSGSSPAASYVDAFKEHVQAVASQVIPIEDESPSGDERPWRTRVPHLKPPGR